MCRDLVAAGHQKRDANVNSVGNLHAGDAHTLVISVRLSSRRAPLVEVDYHQHNLINSDVACAGDFASIEIHFDFYAVTNAQDSVGSRRIGSAGEERQDHAAGYDGYTECESPTPRQAGAYGEIGVGLNTIVHNR